MLQVDMSAATRWMPLMMLVSPRAELPCYSLFKGSFCCRLQDHVAEYAATRFGLAAATGNLQGNFTYTNRGLPGEKARFSNAGTTVCGALADCHRPCNPTTQVA
jgi:hypothetical protein